MDSWDEQNKWFEMRLKFVLAVVVIFTIINFAKAYF